MEIYEIGTEVIVKHSTCSPGAVGSKGVVVASSRTGSRVRFHEGYCSECGPLCDVYGITFEPIKPHNRNGANS